MCSSTQFIVILLLQFSQYISCNLIGDAKGIDDDHGELSFANIVCRHSDRNIVQTYPDDEFGSEDFWPGGYGALTNTGKQQHYLLGQYFRRRYSKLIGNGDYQSEKINILSTDVDRTIMSAEANLAGFFPPSGDQIWNQNIAWQPIPVHVLPRDFDYFLRSTRQCDRFDFAFFTYLNEDDRFNKLMDQHRPLIDLIQSNSGQSDWQFTDALNIRDALYVEQLKGFPIPDWGKEIMTPGGELEQLVANWYAIDTSTDLLKRLKSGFLLKDILDHFEKKLDSKSSKQTIQMYFAHEKEIIELLNSLGMFKDRPHIPDYASCLLFELYQTADDAYVKIFYENANDVQLLRIPNCIEKCPLQTFYDLFGHILPTQSFEEECALRDGEVIPPGGNPATRRVQLQLRLFLLLFSMTDIDILYHFSVINPFSFILFKLNIFTICIINFFFARKEFEFSMQKAIQLQSQLSYHESQSNLV